LPRTTVGESDNAGHIGRIDGDVVTGDRAAAGTDNVAVAVNIAGEVGIRLRGANADDAILSRHSKVAYVYVVGASG